MRDTTPPTDSPASARVEDQLRWYEEAGRGARRWFQGTKVVELLAAAAIPIAAVAAADELVTAVLGGVIVVLEGLQQLFQYQQNWIRYRSTAEALKRERSLFASQAGPYADAARPDAVLAERVEELLASEQAGWATARQEPVGR